MKNKFPFHNGPKGGALASFVFSNPKGYQFDQVSILAILNAVKEKITMIFMM